MKKVNEMGLLNKLKRHFEPCEHIWRFAGSGLRKALVPEWLFKCESCGTKKWRAEGCYPTEESYLFYKNKMDVDFKEHWSFIVNDSDNTLQLAKNKLAILNGTYFEE